jgi:hypothetical protein
VEVLVAMKGTLEGKSLRAGREAEFGHCIQKPTHWKVDLARARCRHLPCYAE